MTDLDLARIQGFVVRGYRSALRPLPVPADRRRRASRRLARRDHRGRAHGRAVVGEAGVGGQHRLQLTRACAHLQLPDATSRRVPRGVPPGDGRARETARGRRRPAPPRTGRAGLGRPAIHVLVMISAMSREALDAHDAATACGHRANRRAHGPLRRRRRRAARTASSISATPTASPSHRSREVACPRSPGQGAVEGGGWRPIRAGEFILGYLDEEGVLPAAPPPAELSTNGSYLVYRKLHQDVAAFRKQLADVCQALSGRRRAVGRQDRRTLARRYTTRLSHLSAPIPRS